MKQNINDFESSEDIDPLEEANKRFISESMSMPALKEMGDAGVAEEAGQFGDAGSSRTVKATPKAMPKAKPTPKAESKPAPKPETKASEMPVDMTKLSANERTKQSIQKNLAEARSGSGSTDTRSVNDRIRDSDIGSSISNYFKNFKTPAQRKAQEQKEKASKGSYSSGGSVSSASKRGDGIAQRGKTRGKMC